MAWISMAEQLLQVLCVGVSVPELGMEIDMN